MNIGEIKNVEGRLIGAIATRTIDLPRIGLRPVESQNERAPVFEVVARNVGGRWVQIGALWEQTSNGTGEVFLQGSLDDPSMTEPLPIALFGSDEDGYRIAWRRPQRRDDLSTAARAPRQRFEGQGEGGFGDSTAGAGGPIGDGAPGSGIDDDLPF
jgi:uncharacterized protein (DUF736 family)